MTAQAGALVLVKAGDGGNPETFTTIGGLRVSAMAMEHQIIDATSVESGPWRLLLAAGIQRLRIGGAGIFTDAASEEMARANAFAGTINNYQFHFADGAYLTGPFLIASYERSGNHDAEEVYSLMLESAGPVTYAAS